MIIQIQICYDVKLFQVIIMETSHKPGLAKTLLD